MSVALAPSDAESLEQCVAGGGIAVFPTDTVYGVCCDPESEHAARRLYALKGRAPRRACAVMFFDLDPALRALEELSESERLALAALLPGPVTVLVRNPAQRFGPACRKDPTSLGVRVPLLPESLAALA
jgi:L-threonylcarbamoyladenylate synthase